MVTAGAAAGPSYRAVLVRLHRYVGLALALFLVLAGVTGSAIAFREELDAWLNPDLFRTTGSGEALRPAEIVARVEAGDPRIRVALLPLPHEPGEALAVGVEPGIDPATKQRFAVDYNQVFVDPVTGAVLGHRKFGACCLERQNLLPFLYNFHYTLTMPGRWGVWLMGGVALVWLVDCFVALVLTFPRARPFLRAWRAAWRIKRGASAYRTTFDLHRAGGLWLWVVLLLVALSGAAINLNEEVFRPAVALFSDLKPSVREQGRARLGRVPLTPTLSFEDAIARARDVIAARGWAMAPTDVYYARPYSVYIVSVARPGADHDDGLGHPHLYFDAQDGALVRADVPGEGSAGDVFIQIQTPIHGGRIAGLAGRIVIVVSGIAVAVLSITGVAIWWRKRRGRAARALHG
jgi:uncharacterized iron-regulated membrane protein